MDGVWYAGIGAAFVLGLLFLVMYARRGRGIAPTGLETAESVELRQAAHGEAAALRQAAQTEAEGLRRAAEADAEATRQAARADQQAARTRIEETLAKARDEAESVLAEARRAGAAEARALTADLQQQQAAHAARVARLDETERLLDARESRVTARAGELHELETELAGTKRELDAQLRQVDAERAELEQAVDAHTHELERIAGLSAEQAKAELLATVEAGARREAAVLVRTIENEARAEGTTQARNIVAEAVQRVASAQTTETVVSVLHLPAEEMKGRIIGREGRNIRSFEAVTGVNVLIDDTPEAVLLSCFDPVRREVGRRTLEKLVQDGRIHPHRIEEAYEQSTAEVDEVCLRAARDALAEVGVGGVDDRLLPTIGRLKYRTSYGQNVLGHLIETAHIAGVMAAELGIEPTLVKRCAFLHDIGKALTHEVEGSHAIIGAELLRKFGESEAVAHAVEAHHNEVQPRTIEAVLTQASDTCSAARPGARRESVEAYVKRLARIEEIAQAHAGVDKVFAMQSGREVRVMVQPSQVDDLGASVVAREIAKQIEDELTYPGQIRVTVVRESRSTEIAH
ncbi:MAG TPA: ribonuclease Y [Jatrophihabitans sp.]|nr:ribonuclease Y [Jatrophihabitans sp.]